MFLGQESPQPPLQLSPVPLPRPAVCAKLGELWLAIIPSALRIKQLVRLPTLGAGCPRGPSAAG